MFRARTWLAHVTSAIQKDLLPRRQNIFSSFSRLHRVRFNLMRRVAVKPLLRSSFCRFSRSFKRRKGICCRDAKRRMEFIVVSANERSPIYFRPLLSLSFPFTYCLLYAKLPDEEFTRWHFYIMNIAGRCHNNAPFYPKEKKRGGKFVLYFTLALALFFFFLQQSLYF